MAISGYNAAFLTVPEHCHFYWVIRKVMAYFSREKCIKTFPPTQSLPLEPSRRPLTACPMAYRCLSGYDTQGA